MNFHNFHEEKEFLGAKREHSAEDCASDRERERGCPRFWFSRATNHTVVLAVGAFPALLLYDDDTLKIIS